MKPPFVVSRDPRIESPANGFLVLVPLALVGLACNVSALRGELSLGVHGLHPHDVPCAEVWFCLPHLGFESPCEIGDTRSEVTLEDHGLVVLIKDHSEVGNRGFVCGYRIRVVEYEVIAIYLFQDEITQFSEPGI